MSSVRRRDQHGRRGVRRAVVLMPNGLTLFNLFCGIYAIILALHGRIAEAPGFIVLGGIADTLDGRVARATGTGSRFGEELDSLVDAISFGFAPALITFLGRPADAQGNLDWLLVFIFTACAVMRLARFNVEQAGRKKTHFHGLPSPAAGLTLATYYWFAQTPLYNQTVILFTDSRTLSTLPWTNLMRGLMALLAALMVSDVPYPAVPSIGFNSIKKILGTLAIAGSVVLLLVRREEFIFPALLAYVAYGIVKWMTLGFIGRSSTPDEIFWEREAELHQEDERRSAFDRPHIGKEALEDVDDEESEEPVRARRDREGDRERGRRDERRPKSRDKKRREGRRAESSRDESRDESRRDEARREERPRDEARRERGERPARSERPPRPERPERQEPHEQPNPESRPDSPAVELPVADAVFSADEGDETSSDERSNGAGDSEVRRKRRRRRGRGRSRGDRAVRGAGGDEGGDSQDGSNEPSGDAPPGPSLPDTPSPSGPTE